MIMSLMSRRRRQRLVMGKLGRRMCSNRGGKHDEAGLPGPQTGLVLYKYILCTQSRHTCNLSDFCNFCFLFLFFFSFIKTFHS